MTNGEYEMMVPSEDNSQSTSKGFARVLSDSQEVAKPEAGGVGKADRQDVYLGGSSLPYYYIVLRM